MVAGECRGVRRDRIVKTHEPEPSGTNPNVDVEVRRSKRSNISPVIAGVELLDNNSISPISFQPCLPLFHSSRQCLARNVPKLTLVCDGESLVFSAGDNDIYDVHLRDRLAVAVCPIIHALRCKSIRRCKFRRRRLSTTVPIVVSIAAKSRSQCSR